METGAETLRKKRVMTVQEEFALVLDEPAAPQVDKSFQLRSDQEANRGKVLAEWAKGNLSTLRVACSGSGRSRSASRTPARSTC